MERGPLVSRTKMHGVQLQYKLIKGMHDVSRGSCLVAVILVGAEVGVHSDGRGLGRAAHQCGSHARDTHCDDGVALPLAGSDVMGKSDVGVHGWCC